MEGFQNPTYGMHVSRYQTLFYGENGGLPVAFSAPVKPDLQVLKLKPDLQEVFKLHLVPHIQLGIYLPKYLIFTSQPHPSRQEMAPTRSSTSQRIPNNPIRVNAQHQKQTAPPLNQYLSLQLRDTLAVQKAHKATV